MDEFKDHEESDPWGEKANDILRNSFSLEGFKKEFSEYLVLWLNEHSSRKPDCSEHTLGYYATKEYKPW